MTLKFHSHSRHSLCLCILLTFLAGCASVPPESVRLSRAMGQDLAALQASYEALIDSHFERLKAERLRYVEEEWTPAYISEWINDGMLRETARGEVVYDESAGEFVQPTPGVAEKQLLGTVESWADAAIHDIDSKKAELLEPLESDRKKLLRDVRLGFAHIQEANANITALLQSLTDLQGAQAEALERMKLNNFAEKISARLADVSDKAASALERIRELNSKLPTSK